MKKLLCLLHCLLLCLPLAGCAAADGRPSLPEEPPGLSAAPETTGTPFSSPSPAPVPTPAPTPSPEELRAAAVEEALAQMTLAEKAASLFWIRPEALAGEKLVFTRKTWDAWEACPVSGLVLFDGNIRGKEQVRAMAEDFRALAGADFVMAVDEEGGRVSRLGGADGFPRTAAAGRLGKEDDPDAIYAAYFSMGEALRDWGFTLDFAPVADLAESGGADVIGNRSFGPDPDSTALCVAEAARALRDGGVEACLKHFPGHGGASGDSHRIAVSLPHGLARLQSAEWVPFAAGLKAGARLVMAGHISLPNAAGDGTPASLSKTIVTEYLRGLLGFDGLVVTDSMEMGAVTALGDAGELAVRALEAGCDIILMPADLQAACEGVLRAVGEGRLTEARIDESVRRRLEVFMP